ncbi:MAG TPA: histidine phosphatase family protein [Rhizomicrobium sp.]|nr:histidine phosphatase family protein [Rhizomicrobium sp.]
MKRLYILRHAKAAQAEPGQDDHARALTVRGIADAEAMARYMRKNGAKPDRVLISTSARTIQTADLVLRELDGVPRGDYRDGLYLAAAGKIATILKSLPAKLSEVMVVGHNPGLEELAALLAREPVRRKERERRGELDEKFPTAALAVLDFDMDRWRDLKPGTGKLADFVRPKDL